MGRSSFHYASTFSVKDVSIAVIDRFDQDVEHYKVKGYEEAGQLSLPTNK